MFCMCNSNSMVSRFLKMKTGNPEKDLLKSNRMGRGYGDICIHIADSLCYTAETNTPL